MEIAGVSRLRIDLEIECWDGSHWDYSMGAALLGFIIWSNTLSMQF